MVVTVSLAKGAVRAAAGKHSTAALDAFTRLKATGIRPPATHRGFADWFRRYKAIMEKDALLIVFGKVGRRRGGFVSYTPHFEELDGGWKLGIQRLQIEFSPGLTESLNWTRLPIRISGHALERMFQRINTIEWPEIRECLAGATLFANALAPVLVAAGFRQCAIPAEKGMLVGNVHEGSLELRTFLPESQLNHKWKTRYEDLLVFFDENTEFIHAAALAPDAEPHERLREIAASGKHAWMRDAYVAGVDPLEDAWRSKD